MDGTIERQSTEIEKQDFIVLGTKTVFSVFNEQLAFKELEWGKKFVPFDSVCARLEFRDKVEQAEKESQRIYGFVKQDLKIEIGDLDKYANKDRFELLEDQEDKEQILVNGLRTNIITGHTLSYKCKSRGHGIAVFIPIADYEKLKK